MVDWGKSLFVYPLFVIRGIIVWAACGVHPLIDVITSPVIATRLRRGSNPLRIYGLLSSAAITRQPDAVKGNRLSSRDRASEIASRHGC